MSTDPDNGLAGRLRADVGGATQGLDPDVFKAASDDVIQWCENLTTIDGQRMDYDGDWRFWRQPMRDLTAPADEAPRNHVWKFARGVGKTVQAARAKWFEGTTNELRDCLYSTPRMRQIRTFQKTVVRRMVNNSRGDPPILKALLDGHQVNVQRNDLIGGTQGPGSALEARSAWADGNQLQGYRGQFGVLDEMQQWSTPAIENIKNAVDKGKARLLMTGTPNYEGTVYGDYWKESDQHEWYWECPECDHEDTLTLDNIHRTGSDPPTYDRFCMECGEEISKEHILHTGYWKATNPEGFHRGYHMNQLASPRHDLNVVMREYNRPTTPESEFVRYRLAEFYSGAAKPIPEQAVQLASDEELGLRIIGLDDQDHYIGVDWGGGEGSDTVAVVIHVNDRDEKNYPTDITVDRVEVLNHDTRQENRAGVAELIDNFNVPDGGRAVMDMGYGSEHLDLLQNGDANDNAIPEHGWGSLVLGHYWNTSVDREQEEWNYLILSNDNTAKANKPPWANRVIRLFPRVQGYDDTSHAGEVDYSVQRSDEAGITIPYADDGDCREIVDYWTNHLTAVKREYKESEQTGKKREYFTTFSPTQKDDGFHALLYAYTAATIGSTSMSHGSFDISGMTGGT